VIVVKIGGSEGVDIESVCADLAEWIRGGEAAVLVHGGSHESTDVAERIGHPPRFVTSVSGHSSRYTDRETMEILAMVMGGRINALLVERLQGPGSTGVCWRRFENRHCGSLRTEGRWCSGASTAAGSIASTRSF
jgi:acetylglutamate/LysW-gamma-L-alpha-aminoadipate kinase